MYCLFFPLQTLRLQDKEKNPKNPPQQQKKSAISKNASFHSTQEAKLLTSTSGKEKELQGFHWGGGGEVVIVCNSSYTHPKYKPPSASAHCPAEHYNAPDAAEQEL